MTNLQSRIFRESKLETDERSSELNWTEVTQFSNRSKSLELASPCTFAFVRKTHASGRGRWKGRWKEFERKKVRKSVGKKGEPFYSKIGARIDGVETINSLIYNVWCLESSISWKCYSRRSHMYTEHARKRKTITNGNGFRIETSRQNLYTFRFLRL